MLNPCVPRLCFLAVSEDLINANLVRRDKRCLEKRLENFKSFW